MVQQQGLQSASHPPGSCPHNGTSTAGQMIWVTIDLALRMVTRIAVITRVSIVVVVAAS
jgi:hypothetical protein